MKLFVRNLPWSAGAADLEIFLASEGYGAAEVKIVSSPEDGRSRGFGFVTFQDEASYEAALRDLGGREFMGRELYVAPAVDRPRGGQAGGRRSGGRRPEGRRREERPRRRGADRRWGWES